MTRPHRWIRNLFALGLLAFSTMTWAAGNPEGYWVTIDDETGHKKSVVHIWKDDAGKIQGQIVKLYREPDEEADPLCDDCEGELHNKRIIGMTILRDLVEDGDEWSDGTILDPGNGETYRCYIELLEGGQKLKLRGYIGFALLGRTQYWLKAEKPTDEVEYLK